MKSTKTRILGESWRLDGQRMRKMPEWASAPSMTLANLPASICSRTAKSGRQAMSVATAEAALAHVWTVRDGLIATFRQIADTAAINIVREVNQAAKRNY